MPRRRTATVGTPGRRVRASSTLGVELEPVAPGEIDHVERDDRRQPELDQLQRETQMIVEVRRVEHDDQGVGLALALLPAEQHVAGDRLVGACRIEAVGAGQVDQLDRAAVGERQPARMPLDRHAGIIGDLLPGAGQRVEQRALAGIGAAGHGDERRRGHWRQGKDAHRAGVLAADRDGHPADADRDRVAAERPQVQRLDRDAFIEAEIPAGAALRQLRARPNRSTATRALAPMASWSRLIVPGWKCAFILAIDYH